MVKRHLANLTKAHLKNYPAVALLGARQSGKTTLAPAKGSPFSSVTCPVSRHCPQTDTVKDMLITKVISFFITYNYFGTGNNRS